MKPDTVYIMSGIIDKGKTMFLACLADKFEIIDRKRKRLGRLGRKASKHSEATNKSLLIKLFFRKLVIRQSSDSSSADDEISFAYPKIRR